MHRYLDNLARMNFPMLFLLLLALKFAGAVYLPNSSLITRRELQSLNANCDPLDTCRGRQRGNDDIREVNCQCGSYCSRFGTCCMDVNLPLKDVRGYSEGMNCSYTPGSMNPVYMVESCPKEWDGDASVRDLCLASAEEKNDLMLMVPVSSLKTGITYRNYFCYTCNTVDDLDDSFISWDVRVKIQNDDRAIDLSDLSYHQQQYQWTYPGAPENMYLYLLTEAPQKLIDKHSIFCRSGSYRGTGVISSCPAYWTDDETRTKCASYTALVYLKDAEGYSDLYRNVHCGICNGGTIDSVWCSATAIATGVGYGGGAGGIDKAYQELFRIEENPEEQCPEGKLYDKVTKKCRPFRCGKKMEMTKGRCVRKQ